MCSKIRSAHFCAPTRNLPRLSLRQLSSGWAPARHLACSLGMAPLFDSTTHMSQDMCSRRKNSLCSFLSPRVESNHDQRLRSPLFYPLNYKGIFRKKYFKQIIRMIFLWSRIIFC